MFFFVAIRQAPPWLGAVRTSVSGVAPGGRHPLALLRDLETRREEVESDHDLSILILDFPGGEEAKVGLLTRLV